MLREKKMQAAAMIYSQYSAIYIIFKTIETMLCIVYGLQICGEECPA